MQIRGNAWLCSKHTTSPARPKEKPRDLSAKENGQHGPPDRGVSRSDISPFSIPPTLSPLGLPACTPPPLPVQFFLTHLSILCPLAPPAQPQHALFFPNV